MRQAVADRLNALEKDGSGLSSRLDRLSVPLRVLHSLDAYASSALSRLKSPNPFYRTTPPEEKLLGKKLGRPLGYLEFQYQKTPEGFMERKSKPDGRDLERIAVLEKAHSRIREKLSLASAEASEIRQGLSRVNSERESILKDEAKFEREQEAARLERERQEKLELALAGFREHAAHPSRRMAYAFFHQLFLDSFKSLDPSREPGLVAEFFRSELKLFSGACVHLLGSCFNIQNGVAGEVFSGLLSSCGIKRVLEIGPGGKPVFCKLGGFDVAEAAGLELFALDLLPARKDFPGVDFRQGDVFGLKQAFPGASFDLILAGGVLSRGGLYVNDRHPSFPRLLNETHRLAELLCSCLSDNPHAAVVASSLMGVLALQPERLLPGLNVFFWLESSDEARKLAVELFSVAAEKGDFRNSPEDWSLFTKLLPGSAEVAVFGKPRPASE